MTNFWQDRRVFITGAAGLLGSWLSAELHAQGADIVGLVRDHSPNSQLVRNGIYDKITVVYGDICSYELMEKYLAEYEIDTIFHLAAQTIVGIANRAPLSTFESNIKGTWTLLEAARRNPTVSRVIAASSDKAYGDQPDMPYKEDAPYLALHPYDVSKSAADMICMSYAHSFEMPIVVTRCANLYGGGDLNWNRIVPGTIRSLLRGEQPIIRSDGLMERDYMLVQDAVRAYVMAAEHALDDGVKGEAFNFGINRPITVLEIVESLVAMSDTPDMKPIILNQASNEIRTQYLNSDKAGKVLGWEPQYDLTEGLRTTFAWYREYLQA